MVQQLAIHTIGGVVTPAQMLMLVVPTESRLEIEAMISNRDIGFVEAGQDAAIKIDTFNFTRYGLLQGKVLGISQDAITRNKPQDRAGDAPAARKQPAANPKARSWFMPRGSRSTAPKWTSRTSASIFHPEWR